MRLWFLGLVSASFETVLYNGNNATCCMFMMAVFGLRLRTRYRRGRLTARGAGSAPSIGQREHHQRVAGAEARGLGEGRAAGRDRDVLLARPARR